MGYTKILIKVRDYSDVQKQKALNEAWLLMGNAVDHKKKDDFEQLDIFDFLLSGNEIK